MELGKYLREHVQEWSKPTLDPKIFTELKYSTSITPSQYLEFAEKDLRSGGPRGLVNSLTNAKRAIDCQIYGLLSAFGIPEPNNFPKRLELVGQLGVVAPRLIRKVVQLRNVLEHEYYRPKASEAEDALDIATLFLETCKPFFSGGNYMESAWIADEQSENKRTDFVRTKTHTIWRHGNEPKYTYASGIIVTSEANKHVVELCLILNNIEVGRYECKPMSPGYFDLQRLMLRTNIDNIPYSRLGANKFLKVLNSMAP